MKAFNKGRIISIILFMLLSIFAVNVWADYTDYDYTCIDQGDPAITINIQVPKNGTIHKVNLIFNTDASSIVSAEYNVNILGVGSWPIGIGGEIHTDDSVPGSNKFIRLSEIGPGQLVLAIFEKPLNPPRGTMSGGGSETWEFNVSGLTTPYSVTGQVKSYDDDALEITSGDRATISSDPCLAAANMPPTATIDSPTGPGDEVTISEGESLDFQGTGTDTDGSITAWQWDFDGGAPNQNVEDPGSVTFNTAGDYTVTFTVTDDDSATGSDSVVIHVSTNLPPTATIDSPSGPGDEVTISAGDSLDFQGTGTDTDGSITAWQWDFGGGAPNQNVEDPGSVTFNTAGDYTVTFTVTDDDSATGSDTVTIHVTRAPREVVLVVDHSGSMIGEKWDTTVTAANTFVDLLYELNLEFSDPQKDKVGVVSYTSDTGSNCCWTFGVTHADAIEIRPLDIPPPGLDIDSLWPAQIFDMTPTGEGLIGAINAFENSDPPNGTENEKYILLLTDGQNNSGYYTIDDFVTAFGSHANPQINALKVYSVVIGEDSYIWPERIAQLSVVDSQGEYRVTDDPVILPEFFAQILGNIVIAEEILPNTSLGEFCTNAPVGSYCTGGEDKVALIATWDRSDGGPYYLRASHTPSPQEINPTNFNTFINVKKSYTLPTDSYTFYILEETTDTPGPGEQKAELGGDSAWSLRLVDNTNAPVTVPSVRFFVLHDLKVRTDFSFDRKKHGTGDHIVFKAEIKESGQPVLNAKVKVNIKRPGEGAGELMFRTPPPLLAASREAKKDGLSPIFLHMKEVFKVLGRNYLLSLDNEVTLLDNGTGEDEVAGDGIYTGVFSDLRYEGNYTFKFTAEGTSPQNRTFARTKSISQFVKMNVAPDLSKFKYWVNPKILDGRIREVWVLFEPVDKFGSHLGPYRDDYLKYEFTGGEPQDKIEYYFDREDKKGGKYYQRILFNDRKQLPRVRVKYQGTPIGKQLSLRTFNRFEISIHGGLFANYRINQEKEVKFDSTSPIYQLRLAYNPRKIYGFEASVGLVPTTNQLGDKGRFFQCGFNVFYNLQETKFSSYRLTPFLTMGVGAFLYRGFNEDDESFAWNFGVGFKYLLGNLFELRYDIRHFLSFGAYGSKTRNHLQTTVGIAFSLK